MLQFAREMLAVVSTMQYPEGLGKMEMRIGIHVGPLYAGEFAELWTRTCCNNSRLSGSWIYLNNNPSTDGPTHPNSGHPHWACRRTRLCMQSLSKGLSL